MRNKLAYIAGLVLIATAVIAATTAVVLPDYTFTSTQVVNISNTDLQPSYLTAVEMSFGSAQVNAFTVTHTRDGIDHLLVSVPAVSMTTVTWYAPRPLFLKDGDTLTFSNTAAVVAALNLSTEKYKN